MIIGYMGQMREGKTLSAVKEVYKQYKRGRTIYSNISLSFAHKHLTLQMLIDVVEGKLVLEGNPLVFIDEVHIWLDSRTSPNKRNRIISYFLLQTGKLGKDNDYGLILIYTTQYSDQIDKRLRHTTSIVVECEKHELGLRKVFGETVTIIKGKKTRTYPTKYYFGEPYYFLYNTREVVNLEGDI